MKVIDCYERSKEANHMKATAATHGPAGRGYLAPLSLTDQYGCLWVFVWMEY